MELQMSAGVVAALGALSVFLLFYAIWSPFRSTETNSLDAEFGTDRKDDLPQDGLGKYARPLLDNFMPQFPAPTISQANRKKLAEFVTKAGNPWKLTPEEYSSMKFVFGGIGFFVGLIFAVFQLLPVEAPLVILLFTGMGSVLPYVIYNSNKDKRSADAQKQLPEALDLLVVTLTSGKTFEAGLNQVVPQLPDGLIKDELNTVNLKVKAGTSLEKALNSFSNEIESDEIESFVQAIIRAQKLGADVTETLVQQASFARDSHEARLEKMIAKLPTTMVIPLTATMMPAFFIIFLAPALQQMQSML